MFEIAVKIFTVVSGTAGESDDYYRKGRGEGVRELITYDRNYHKRK